MLQTLVQMDKMEALWRKLTKMGMLAGTTSSYLAQIKTKESEIDNTSDMETMSESHVDAVTVDDKEDLYQVVWQMWCLISNSQQDLVLN